MISPTLSPKICRRVPCIGCHNDDTIEFCANDIIKMFGEEARILDYACRKYRNRIFKLLDEKRLDYVDTTGVVVEDFEALKVVDKAIVPVYEWKGLHGVSARAIHQFLDSKQEFTNWVKQRIEKYGFVKGEDYLIILSNRSDGRAGKPRTEYFLTMDTAKEIAMVENNEKGRMIRRHFIEIEKKYRAGVAMKPPKEPGIIDPPKDEETLALPESEAPEVLPRAISSRYPDKRYWTPEEAAVELGLAGYRVLYDKLADLGLVKRTKQGVVPLKERRQFIRQWTFKSKGGNNSKRPVITPWGMDYLESVL